MHCILLEYYARFVDIKISEHSGDTQVSSREDIEEGACRSVESSKLIFSQKYISIKNSKCIVQGP